MTAPRPGDAFRLDLDRTVIAGRPIEVDPPHRLVIGWNRQGTDNAQPTPALILFMIISFRRDRLLGGGQVAPSVTTNPVVVRILGGRR